MKKARKTAKERKSQRSEGLKGNSVMTEVEGHLTAGRTYVCSAMDEDEMNNSEWREIKRKLVKRNIRQNL